MATEEIQISSTRPGALSSACAWLRALRPESFPASVVPALLGAAVARQQGWRIDPWLALLTLAGAVAIHAATNLLQDYFDYRSGLDREGTQGGSGVLVSGLKSPRAILAASAVFYVVSAALAAYLIHARGIELLYIVAAGLVVGSGYAVPRYGLKYNLLGDVGVFAAFGVGITMGSYYIQTGRLEAYPLLYAVPFGLLVVALLHANNMRDARDDLEAGLRNTAQRLGQRASRAFYALLVLGAYAMPAALVFAGIIPRGAIAVVITLPAGFRLAGRAISQDLDASGPMGAQVTDTALLALAFGIAMILGVVFG